MNKSVKNLNIQMKLASVRDVVVDLMMTCLIWLAGKSNSEIIDEISHFIYFPSTPPLTHSP